jgi:conjugal transfer/entry exclusion protein
MGNPNVAVEVIAVTNLSVKVASLCLQYSRLARNTNNDINQLHQEVTNVKNILENLPSNRRLRVPGG